MQTIATFTMPEEAHLLRMRLSDVGIPAWVLDEHVVQLNHFYSNVIGVRVQVADDMVEEAREFLKADAISTDAGPAPADTELATALKRERRRHAFGWLTVILLGSPLLGFPLLLFHAGAEWNRVRKS